MIFFGDMYNLIYNKLYGSNCNSNTYVVAKTENKLLYNGWIEYLNLKEQFLLDISNIIYNYQFDYKNSPSHFNDRMNENKKRPSKHFISIDIEDKSGEFYYMCNCSETLRKQLQKSLGKLVYNVNKEWIDNTSIMITQELSYLLRRVKDINREIYFNIYDDIENQNSLVEPLKSKNISSSKLLYNSVYDIVFNNELIKKYNYDNNVFFCNYCGEENGLIINNRCYDCYLYIDISNNLDIV
jgi:hypothetical protein